MAQMKSGSTEGRAAAAVHPGLAAVCHVSQKRLPAKCLCRLMLRAPTEDDIHIRFLPSGSEAQDKGDSRNLMFLWPLGGVDLGMSLGRST